MLFVPQKRPEVLSGQYSVMHAADIIDRRSLRRPFIVTSRSLIRSGAYTKLTKYLDSNKVQHVLFSDVSPNPTDEIIELALKRFLYEKCDVIIALGGGSVMDCAKAVAARAAQPKKSLWKLKGQLKVRKEVPVIIAVPTTAGTGSETTVAAVVTDTARKVKFAINDPVLVPRFAILDPTLLVSLPPKITAITGMDTLTHAVEAYIGRSNTSKTSKDAEKAVTLVFENLEKSYHDGTDLATREKMLEASFLAGAAFTRAFVGNVHALAHALGAFYDTPHGLANAVILPLVLREYGKKAHKKLARLYRAAGGTGYEKDNAGAANAFIERIERLNEQMSIPTALPEILPADIPALAKHAAKEANPLYPVPVIFDLETFGKLLKEVGKKDK